ncbi:proline racemase family protein [Paenibacillus sp. N1-5-1-14]|uniref:proline racemase family protein n=1 Tax=Paenibacillus radicibacter TaxID=2972488 RepID=UPI0021590127|nr:proline racemase family protein [Paenibacillus radicibacter]MCR8644774.1 proline racemase family protein [Paenibacillus radicibacter]
MQVKQLFTTIDAHTGGEPLRIITGGIPPLRGNTILEKRAYFRENLDYIRQVLMYEPRGHHGMYGCVITPPVSDDADFGVLFMHNEGYSSMCGHGIIAVVTAVIETGFLQVEGNNPTIIIDSPAGKIIAEAKIEGNEVKSVSFENVPSFVFASDVVVKLEDREILVDIAFGGAFYAIVHAKDLDVKVDIEHLAQMQKLGSAIKHDIESKMVVQHPLEAELQGIYGVIISDEPKLASSHLRNVTVFAEEQIDRSPCGTGTCARIAALHARGEYTNGELFVHEGIVDSQFISQVMEKTEVAGYAAIVPRVEGNAFITGMHQFVVDPTDPLAKGFLLS